ncbi:DUF4252 domain-containing protein [Fulvivirga sp. 29W222]|uniref:DUF4252 domain-containing protein n=1 Tax=Fulvivirga marina TaxID=2494733 RepID=A0A937KCG0_9BACT|nr:DUF4252 domain-containing protein [Fulvivirga marina]MBL6445203.1 DUF4252 domain-containing protein [Fulvivirga marina]
MKKFFSILTVTYLVFGVVVFGQSKTTKAFAEKYDDAFTLFFYNNTLKMLNQEGNEEFDELIKDIDKMKFIRVDKKQNKLTDADFKGMVEKYHDEDFEDLMTMSHEGMKVNVYILEEGGVTSGLVLLMSDPESFSVLDIVGAVPLNKLASLISKVQDIN